MEDVQIGRDSSFIERFFTVSTVSKQILGGAPNRIAIIFGNATVGPIWVSTKNPAVSGQGLLLSVVGIPIMLDIQRHGLMVTMPWYALTNAGTDTFSFFEVLLNR